MEKKKKNDNSSNLLKNTNMYKTKTGKTIEEMNSEISWLRNQNIQLETKKKKYITLKGQVEKTKADLEISKSKLTEVENELGITYVSDNGSQGKINFEDEVADIERMINSLNYVLAEINTKIEEITTSITTNSNRMGRLRAMISMEK